MRYEKFLKLAASKVGPKEAMDMIRDAQVKAMQIILIDKNIMSRSELNDETFRLLAFLAEQIKDKPPLPPEERYQ